MLSTQNTSEKASASQTIAPKYVIGGATPAPWRFDETWHLIIGPNGEEVAAIHAAQIGDTNKRGDRETVYANAELIASAPALLAERDTLRADNERLRELLTTMLGHLEFVRQHGAYKGQAAYFPGIAQARAALSAKESEAHA